MSYYANLIAKGNTARQQSENTITAPAVKLNYDSPKISTMSGATGRWTPPAGSNPSPIETPSFIQQQPYQNIPAQQNTNYIPEAGGGGAATGGVGIASEAPPPPPKPVMPDYNKWTDQQIEAGDSAFMDQRQLYQNKLQKYVADYENQVGNNAYGEKYDGDFLSQWSQGGGGGRMGGDYRMASQGVGRNREMGLTNVAEDFASRGMSNSGLYADSFQKAIEGYNRQKQGLDSATTGQVQDLSFKRGNFESDTQAGIQSARRDAIGRLMQNFNLTGGA